MSVIVELRVDGDDFELGRALDPPPGSRVELRQAAVEADGTVPFWVDGAGDVATAVEGRDGVESVRFVEGFEGQALYALEWTHDGDRLLDVADDAGARLLGGRGGADGWELDLRFPDEAALASFTDWCSDRDVECTVERRYVPREGPEYGLTGRQHDTIVRAVERGYYDIPRTTTTKELADELGVSDQAVTERLRRAITTLVDRTLLADDR